MNFGKKPVIGILGNTYMTEPGLFKSMERAYANSAYVDSILRNGGIPVMIPAASVAEDAEAALHMCSGILFPGGEDVTPRYYGEEPLPVMGIFKPGLDESWMKAGHYALEFQKPMLGICRGIQVLNVLLGGSLYQDISQKEGEHIQHMQKYDRTYVTHSIDVQPGTKLASLLGAGQCMINSMYHQAVKKLGNGLKVSALAFDGTIEAVEDENELIMAVQWHPENLIDTVPSMNRIFSDLSMRCIKYMK
jgi:putative glutamine amidotransferase